MAYNDFSTIKNIDDLLMRKTILENDIRRSEMRIKKDWDNISKSLVVFKMAYGWVQNIFTFSKNNLNLFLTGFRMFKQFRGGKGNGSDEK